MRKASKEPLEERLLKGSWELVIRVIEKVTILTITYKPAIRVLISLLTRSPDPPSGP